MSFSNPDNAQRAEWAFVAMQALMDVTGTDEEDVIGDLLGNIMHFCAQNNMDFLAHLNQGALHFQAEIEIEEEGDEADPSACAATPHHYRRHDGMAPRDCA